MKVQKIKIIKKKKPNILLKESNPDKEKGKTDEGNTDIDEDNPFTNDEDENNLSDYSDFESWHRELETKCYKAWIRARNIKKKICIQMSTYGDTSSHKLDYYKLN